jgi:hypothetical protein
MPPFVPGPGRVRLSGPLYSLVVLRYAPPPFRRTGRAPAGGRLREPPRQGAQACLPGWRDQGYWGLGTEREREEAGTGDAGAVPLQWDHVASTI